MCGRDRMVVVGCDQGPGSRRPPASGGPCPRDVGARDAARSEGSRADVFQQFERGQWGRGRGSDPERPRGLPAEKAYVFPVATLGAVHERFDQGAARKASIVETEALAVVRIGAAEQTTTELPQKLRSLAMFVVMVRLALLNHYTAALGFDTKQVGAEAAWGRCGLLHRATLLPPPTPPPGPSDIPPLAAERAGPASSNSLHQWYRTFLGGNPRSAGRRAQSASGIHRH